jgi:CheY-like chemotaxis protein
MVSDNILVVDDDEGVLCALKMLFKSEGYLCTTTESPEAALALISKNNFTLVLMDLNYARDTTSGEEGLNLIRSTYCCDDWLGNHRNRS